MKKIGVLAMQGAVAEHLQKLKIIGAAGIAVKYPEQLEGLDGLIIPGGESTAIGKLIEKFELMNPIKEKIQTGLPVWGTCAGMILLAKRIYGQDQTYLAAMNICVKRNAYGSQLDSFTVRQKIKSVSKSEIPMVFIRAPYVSEIGKNVQVLAEVNEHIVAVKEKNILATAFHPELTADSSFHAYFNKMC